MWPCSRREPSSAGAKLWYDRGKQRFYLLVSLTLDTPDPTPESQRQVLGVDVGQRYLATVATLDNGAQFYSGKEIRARRTTMPACKNDFSEKALAAPHGANRHRPARETVEAEYQPHDQPSASWTPIPTLSSGWKSSPAFGTAPSGNMARRRRRGSVAPTGMRASGPSPSCMGCSPIRRSSPGRSASRWMPTTPVRPARTVGTSAARTGPGRGCSSSASSASTPCMPTWWEPGISRSERWSSGKTG